eukprot:10245191-Prorocentrum_lima.AAC.1
MARVRLDLNLRPPGSAQCLLRQERLLRSAGVVQRVHPGGHPQEVPRHLAHASPGQRCDERLQAPQISRELSSNFRCCSDVLGGDADHFRVYQRAYDVLSDPEKREHYDS